MRAPTARPSVSRLPESAWTEAACFARSAVARRGPMGNSDGAPAHLLEVSPFDRHYGLEILDSSDELVRGRVPVREHLTQPIGIVHGGVYAAIAEALASMGTNHGVAAEGKLGLGMSNQSSFL